MTKLLKILGRLGTTKWKKCEWVNIVKRRAKFSV